MIRLILNIMDFSILYLTILNKLFKNVLLLLHLHVANLLQQQQLPVLMLGYILFIVLIMDLQFQKIQVIC